MRWLEICIGACVLAITLLSGFARVKNKRRYVEAKREKVASKSPSLRTCSEVAKEPCSEAKKPCVYKDGLAVLAAQMPADADQSPEGTRLENGVLRLTPDEASLLSASVACDGEAEEESDSTDQESDELPESLPRALGVGESHSAFTETANCTRIKEAVSRSRNKEATREVAGEKQGESSVPIVKATDAPSAQEASTNVVGGLCPSDETRPVFQESEARKELGTEEILSTKGQETETSPAKLAEMEGAPSAKEEEKEKPCEEEPEKEKFPAEEPEKEESPAETPEKEKSSGEAAEREDTSPLDALRDVENVEEELSKEEAEKLKERGNALFKEGKFNEALEVYNAALDSAPRRERALASVIICNCAAVHLSLKEWDEAISCCNDCIELQPEYAKAYLRRSRAYEQQSKFHEALEDLKKAMEFDPNLMASNRGSLSNLERQSAQLHEKEKEEMMLKLKEMGNWALGKLGLSLDNFKVEQNPDTGSYNIQFDQGAGKQNQP